MQLRSIFQVSGETAMDGFRLRDRMRKQLSSLTPNERDTLPWLALKHAKGLGCVSFKRIVDHLGDPRTVFNLSDEDIARVPGLEAPAVNALRGFTDWDQLRVEMEQLDRLGITILPYNHKDYPPRLRTIWDPPPLLYVKGNLAEGADPAIAVVGSRSASEYGLKMTRTLAHDLGSLGFVVVSGMALGIDGAAHSAALRSGGRTLAVLGSGVDVPYPLEHRELYERICNHGAILSEFSLGTPPMAQHFPSRNRLISGLALGVIVVEATEKSGSLITAGLALEQGREVFAVPGQAGSSRSRGTHRLIKQGAKLVERVEDIVEEIAPQLLERAARIDRPPPPALASDAKPEARMIFELVKQNPLQIDEVIEATGFSPARVSEILLDLELKGMLRQLPGKRFVVN